MNWLIKIFSKEIFFYLLISLILISCKFHNYAPVQSAEFINTNTQKQPSQSDTYVVQSGDTLYSIARRYGMDYQTVAQENHISSPYIVKVGQVLSVKSTATPITPATPAVPVTSSVASVPKSIASTPIKQNSRAPDVTETKKLVVNANSDSTTSLHWVWPAKGKIIAHYSPSVGQKGIDIAGQKGEPILAAATGKVAYAGNGLRGYGNLIIISHSKEFLSAYAHNETLLVHEGQDVVAGQKIATMGNSESKRVKLHFEIREAGKSINPLLYVKP